MVLRQSVLGILVGGAPAPGINGVIAAVTIEAINRGLAVIGFFEGFKPLKLGQSKVERLEIHHVTKVANLGGSYLRTSKQQITNAEEADNCLRVLEQHRVRYLVTVGGTDTAHSASVVASLASKARFPLSICHVPKTIFNDLPLPQDSHTFGFSTALNAGVQMVNNLHADARTMLRWYVLVVMGTKAGHLAMSIGKGAAATLTVIPEDYRCAGKTVKFMELVSLVEAAIYKRRAMDKEYGIACIAEGLVDLMDKKEVAERFGNVDNGHTVIGDHIITELQRRFKEKSLVVTTVSRNVGVELRSANPDAADTILTRDLGFGAVNFLLEGGTGCLITFKDGSIVALPLTDLIDPKTGMTRIREVDTSSTWYRVAQSYMIKLQKKDLECGEMLSKLAVASKLGAEEFAAKFKDVADDSEEKKLSYSPLDFKPSSPGSPAKPRKTTDTTRMETGLE